MPLFAVRTIGKKRDGQIITAIYKPNHELAALANDRRIRFAEFNAPFLDHIY